MHRFQCIIVTGWLALLFAGVNLCAQSQYSNQPKNQFATSGQQQLAGAQQNPGPQQLTNQQPVVQQAVAPFPPLTPAFQQYLDKVLDAWQKETSKVERLKCEFKRFQYDPALNATGYYSVASGELKYMAPDKGLFRIDDLRFFTGLDANNKPLFEVNKRNEFGEYWICDGVFVQILDRNEKKCSKIELPPNMRGKQIYLSPLPFLFGVNAAEIKSRFWIQPLVPPEGRSNEVWLEAWPKTSADAQNYSRVQIVLDAVEVLPKGLIVFLPNWRPGAEHKEIYDFLKRDKNPVTLNPFAESFIPDRLPKDWKVIIEPFQHQPPQQPPVAPGNSPRVAQPPSNQPLR